MEEILKKLLESDILSEETKAELTEQVKSYIDGYLSEQRTEIEAEVTAKLTEEFVQAREQLVESVNSKVDTFLAAEFEELHEDINKFRDLEVEYAEKLVEDKELMATQFGEQLDQLVDKLDAFLEVRLDEEFSELKEDISEVKRLQVGAKILEAFEAEYKVLRKDNLSEVEQKLAETEDKLAEATKLIARAESGRLAEQRAAKMDELLAPLSGTSREQMKIILSNVATEKLDEAFKQYIGRIIRESVAPKTEQKTEAKSDQLTESTKPQSKVVTGNEILEEEVIVPQPNTQLSRMQMLAGVRA